MRLLTYMQVNLNFQHRLAGNTFNSETSTKAIIVYRKNQKKDEHTFSRTIVLRTPYGLVSRLTHVKDLGYQTRRKVPTSASCNLVLICK